jgi:hypothetical protein
MAGRIAGCGVKVKGKITLDLDSKIPIENVAHLLNQVGSNQSDSSPIPLSLLQPQQASSRRVLSPHYYSSPVFPVSSKIMDYPENYINPPQ